MFSHSPMIVSILQDMKKLFCENLGELNLGSGKLGHPLTPAADRQEGDAVF